MDRREAGDRQAAVSRTPFREAIWILAREGVIEIKPYRRDTHHGYS
jgi:DNA-binding FadR family transcriptional regulator